ncbi:hypothetical protein CUR65_10485 [Salmonella enterica subsp. enterica serovar Legon]|uniref:response regulator receiver domain n=1 Tax=Salmonella enterica TaxID=28901 RepID=UPI000D3E08BA|nr:response regulator receiver domain [Salmonella enterica]PVB76067.1 hypothetical protein CUR58_08565 [Salmonella enterica subsp. enterica serovar Legon]PVB88685.1 hypothetical protein CUR65_10485 [Salmonella enterica subsp. enterica serovar Legon]PVB92307.1 hypothetical protein CUR66_11735 [Salmonella enterica subsp. enterica serovar Legon]PVB98556.1 hypothetical protein CUR73_14305 [Salmonella enterica subsp. enterica serovar Legon]PVC06225.1 hypothetical protein CUR74_12790 [Salmonella ent
MTANTYNQLVSSTFCDNAIRSVMMIDDEFITYADSIKALQGQIKLDGKKLDSSKRAALLESFFQSKKMICDIDDGVASLDADRIRKSDLIIIDYHLEKDSPDKTLFVLNKLKDSEHLNMVVVYTRENMETVWLQIASMLRGAYDLNSRLINYDNEDIITYWNDVILPDLNSGGGYSLSRPEIVSYIQTGKTIGRIKGILSRNDDITDPKDRDFIANLICEYYIQSSNNLNDAQDACNVNGDRNGIKWLQIGNIFVTLYRKEVDSYDNDAENIWNTLNESLCEWEPSYYQLLKSEIQNKIEAEALSFNIHLANDIYGQAAWLNEIIKTDNVSSKNEKIDVIFGNLSEELYIKLRKNPELKQFINSVFDAYKQGFDACAETDTLKYCAAQMKLPTNQNIVFQDMYHALNMNLSSRNYEEKHISTGTVFWDTDNNNWYLCVSAACDMVPTQGNDPHHERLSPHRLIKVLQLFPVKPDKALPLAHHSKYIYAYDKDERKYFSILKEGKDLPVVDYMIILNHGHNGTELGKGKAKAVVWKNTNGDIEKVILNIKLKSQLRTGYAERYQAIASQYSARIGVDYISVALP